MTGKLVAPLGKCTHVADMVGGGVLVMYSKRDFTPEQWVLISPYNGPCVYREYSADEVREISDDLSQP